MLSEKKIRRRQWRKDFESSDYDSKKDRSDSRYLYFERYFEKEAGVAQARFCDGGVESTYACYNEDDCKLFDKRHNRG
jgi:hypothetical protein